MYKTIVTPAMMYAAEAWAICGRNEGVEMDEWSYQGGQNKK